MQITTEQIKLLREETGAGMMEVKKALEDAGGDMEKAKQVLRLAGVKLAAKKQARTAGQGLVVSYVHGGKLGVLLELRCETDFVARNADFQTAANDLAMQVAAMSPQYLSANDIPQQVLDEERELYRQQVMAEGKSAEIAEKIVEGKMAKYYAQVCLLNQPFIKDDSLTVAQVIEQLTAKIGEKIELGGFCRLQLGNKPACS